MPSPYPLILELSAREREELQTLVRRHTTAQQIAQRGRIILLADAGESNASIARQLDLDVDTVRAWRSRWLALRAVSGADLSVEARLADLPRSGRKAEIRAEQVCQILALACEAPTRSGRPITQWTGREIAEEIVHRGIVEKISPRHASRLLKRGI